MSYPSHNPLFSQIDRGEGADYLAKVDEIVTTKEEAEEKGAKNPPKVRSIGKKGERYEGAMLKVMEHRCYSRTSMGMMFHIIQGRWKFWTSSEVVS
jgi:hypothetical protein